MSSAAILTSMTAEVQDAPLLTPFSADGFDFRNRIVMSPMTRGRAPGGTPCELNAEYYSLRGDAGLIFAESTAISPKGRGYMDNPVIFDDGHVQGWRLVTDAVHERGGLMFLQLWHVGHNSHPLLQVDGGIPIGPCALPVTGLARTPQGNLPLVTPRAIELHEMPGLLDEYRQAALRAKRAGFDGVEVHAGNGYLLDQFLRDSTNKRDDAYGGPPENRRRLLLEVVEAVAEVWGKQRMSVRISPTNPSQFEISDSDPEALFTCVVEGLQEAGIGFLHVVEGAMHPFIDQCPFDFSVLRARFKGVYIANNRYTFESGNEAVRSGHADMVSFGRQFLANPDLIRRFRLGAPLNEVNVATKYNLGASGYTDYPLLDELEVDA
jgi:N-ethylmaleimide reductase